MQVNMPRIRYSTCILTQKETKQSLQQHWFSQNKNKARMDMDCRLSLSDDLIPPSASWYVVCFICYRPHCHLIFSLTVTTRSFPAVLCEGVNDEVVHTRISIPAPTGTKLPQFCCERRVSDSCKSGFTASQMFPAFPQAFHHDVSMHWNLFSPSNASNI